MYYTVYTEAVAPNLQDLQGGSYAATRRCLVLREEHR
jgi:hypothetical protein